jgi:hypothetical protein
MSDRPIVFLDLDETLISSFSPVELTQVERLLEKAWTKPPTEFNLKNVERSQIRVNQIKAAFTIDDLMVIVRPDAQAAIDYLSTFAEVHIFTAASMAYAEAIVSGVGLKFKPDEGRIYSLRDEPDMSWAAGRRWVLIDDTQAYAKIRALRDLDVDVRVILVDPLNLGSRCEPLMIYAREAARRLGIAF